MSLLREPLHHVARGGNTLNLASVKQRAMRDVCPLEHVEQASVIAWASLLENKYPALRNLFAIPNGSNKSKASAVKFKREGLKSGVPDLMLAVTSFRTVQHGTIGIEWHHYYGLFIEMKRERSSVVSPEQEDWHDRLTAAGYRVVVCKGFEEARKAICDYLEIRG